MKAKDLLQDNLLDEELDNFGMELIIANKDNRKFVFEFLFELEFENIFQVLAGGFRFSLSVKGAEYWVLLIESLKETQKLKEELNIVSK